jgi:glutaredoxin
MTNSIIKIIGFLLLLCALQGPVWADIYKWKDEHGNVHFGDRPPASAKTEQVKVRVNTYQSVDTGYSPEWFYKRKSRQSRAQVVMYSAEWCGVCTRAKQYFREQQIPYKNLDIDKSREAREGFDRLGGQGVPIILLGKRRMNGFSAARFEKMYRGEQSQ